MVLANHQTKCTKDTQKKFKHDSFPYSQKYSEIFSKNLLFSITKYANYEDQMLKISKKIIVFSFFLI